MKNQKRISVMILLLSAVLMIGALYIWASPCEGMLRIEGGMTTYMKCHYFIVVGSGIAFLCVAFAVHIFMKKEIPSIPMMTLGFLSILTTISDPLGIGICQADGMPCHTTALWMKIIGGILILCGIYSLIDLDKQL